jgi:hypothetical protein
MNDDDFSVADLILQGAALTIQSCWRKYRKRLGSEREFFGLLCNHCLSNAFRCDVTIFVNRKVYFCHSLVLWSQSRYFKAILEKHRNHNLASYKFELLISNQSWEIVQKYIYGYDITIPRALLNELIYVSKEFKIENLKNELIKLKEETGSDEFVFDNLNTNQNCNSNSSSSISVNFPSMSTVNQHEALCLSSKQPFEVISNNYKFFKCVVNFYRHKKLDYEDTLFYLSTKHIDYSQMDEAQLKKCILMLKTYLNLRNSDLILHIVNVYLNKKNS